MSDDTIRSTFLSCFPLCYFTIVSVSSTTASLHPPRSTFGLLITPSHSPSGIAVHCALVDNYHYPRVHLDNSKCSKWSLISCWVIGKKFLDLNSIIFLPTAIRNWIHLIPCSNTRFPILSTVIGFILFYHNFPCKFINDFRILIFQSSYFFFFNIFIGV